MCTWNKFGKESVLWFCVSKHFQAFPKSLDPKQLLWIQDPKFQEKLLGSTTAPGLGSGKAWFLDPRSFSWKLEAWILDPKTFGNVSKHQRLCVCVSVYIEINTYK